MISDAGPSNARLSNVCPVHNEDSTCVDEDEHFSSKEVDKIIIHEESLGQNYNGDYEAHSLLADLADRQVYLGDDECQPAAGGSEEVDKLRDEESKYDGEGKSITKPLAPTNLLQSGQRETFICSN